MSTRFCKLAAKSASLPLDCAVNNAAPHDALQLTKEQTATLATLKQIRNRSCGSGRLLLIVVRDATAASG
jgi:hypothetical protein